MGCWSKMRGRLGVGNVNHPPTPCQNYQNAHSLGLFGGKCKVRFLFTNVKLTISRTSGYDATSLATVAKQHNKSWPVAS